MLLADGIRKGLEAEGFAVDVAHDGTDGLWRAREHDYDAIVLDIMLPGVNGYRVCATLRAEDNWTPVLMLTAKDGDLDEAEALDTGADDYLTKPFAHVVLVARLRALVRRGRPASTRRPHRRRPPPRPRLPQGLARGRAGDAHRAGDLAAGVPPAAGRDGRVQAGHPRPRLGRRLRGRPQHRRGLHPPPPQQAGPALRPGQHRDRPRARATGSTRAAADGPLPALPGRASAPCRGRRRPPRRRGEHGPARPVVAHRQRPGGGRAPGRRPGHRRSRPAAARPPTSPWRTTRTPSSRSSTPTARSSPPAPTSTGSPRSPTSATRSRPSWTTCPSARTASSPWP